jgi:DNA polymerase III alpha subunit
MNSVGDVDIDFADRTLALSFLDHIPASIISKNKIEKHTTGVYFHVVPVDPLSNLCSIDYDRASMMNCYKIDLLNVSVYQQIKDEEQLLNLINCEIDFKIFDDESFTSKVIHFSNHAPLVSQLKPRSIEHIAMILALIRPGKKYLISDAISNGLSSIQDKIWLDENNGLFTFKKSHSFGYAMLVKVHACLLVQQSA